MFALDNKGVRKTSKGRKMKVKPHKERDYSGRRSTHALRAAMRATHGANWSDSSRHKAQFDKMRYAWKAAAKKVASKYGKNWGGIRNKRTGKYTTQPNRAAVAEYRKLMLAARRARVKFIRSATKSDARSTVKPLRYSKGGSRKTTSRRKASRRKTTRKRGKAKAWSGDVWKKGGGTKAVYHPSWVAFSSEVRRQGGTYAEASEAWARRNPRRGPGPKARRYLRRH